MPATMKSLLSVSQQRPVRTPWFNCFCSCFTILMIIITIIVTIVVVLIIITTKKESSVNTTSQSAEAAWHADLQALLNMALPPRASEVARRSAKKGRGLQTTSFARPTQINLCTHISKAPKISGLAHFLSGLAKTSPNLLFTTKLFSPPSQKK